MLLFAVVAHEFAHGWAALKQGDDTAYKLGRLTLNPVPHIDPVMTLLMPALLWFGTNGAFTFGAARPVPIVPRNFRNYRRGDLIVSSAGVITNAILAIACTVLYVVLGLVHGAVSDLGTTTFAAAQRMLIFGIQLNLILAVFNLIPIPPLDGSRILYHFLPPAMGARYRSLDRFGIILVIALLWFLRPVFSFFMAPAYWAMERLLQVATPFTVADAMMLLN
jgi:Zn-dependent protease